MRSLLAAGLLLCAGPGPFDIPLMSTTTAPAAKGTARMVFAPSPFGAAVTPHGYARYQVQLELTGLPDPASLGKYAGYVAWAASPDLSQWFRLGTVGNGKHTVGVIELNKFLLVITAEAGDSSLSRSGPTILHGQSPSSLLQSFVSHPLFRGIPPE